LRVALLVLTRVLATACSETPKAAPTAAGATAADAATEQLLNDMEGVWRSTDPDQLVYVLRQGHNLRLLNGGVYEADVQLRSVDVKAQSVNLSAAAAGGRVIWTLRKVPGPAAEEPGYRLLMTLDGGEQLDLALVRRVSPEDREFMDGELARLMREDREVDEAEADVEDTAIEEAAVAVDAGAEEVSSDDVKVSKAPLADDAEAAAVPAPIYPTSYDCTHATGSAEVAVCYDEELADLDQKLARAYRKVLAQSDQPEAERSTQMRWLRDKRNACEEDVACLRRVYLNRLKYFAGPPYHAYSEHAE
jgi:uncharacterized protein YecT (DUF1311 family)